ncbi:MAG: GNAT family N-acetyltransferase [Desulfurococcaceae archaeon]
MLWLNRLLEFSDLAVADITEIRDNRILQENMDLIKIGQSEGAFSCIPSLSLNSIIEYRSTMKMITSGLYMVYALLDHYTNLVGYVDIALYLGRGLILGIILAPEYRGRGVGSTLLKVAEHTLKEWGATVFETRIHNSNHISKRFFLRHGYFFSGIYEEYRDSCGNWRVEEVWRKHM